MSAGARRRALAAELARDLEQLARLAVREHVLAALERRESGKPVRARRRARHKGRGPAAPAKNPNGTPKAPEPKGETPAPRRSRLRALGPIRGTLCNPAPAGSPGPVPERKPTVSPPRAAPAEEAEDELGQGDYDVELEAWG